MHTEASPGWGGQEIRIMEEMRWFRNHGHHMMLVAPAHSVLIEKATEEGFETANLLFTKSRTAFMLLGVAADMISAISWCMRSIKPLGPFGTVSLGPAFKRPYEHNKLRHNNNTRNDLRNLIRKNIRRIEHGEQGHMQHKTLCSLHHSQKVG